MAGLVDLTECVKAVNARLLANIGVYATTQTDSERFTTQEVTDAVLEADAQVCMTFLQRKGDGRRVPFFQTAQVAHGSSIPNHIGEVDAILIGTSAAVRSDPTTIDRDRAAIFGTAVEYTRKFYTLGQQLFHNATTALFGTTTATVIYADFTRTGACQAPSELTAAVVALAAAVCFGKNGNKIEATQAYYTIGNGYLAAIARGETELQPLPTDAEARRLMPSAA